MLLLLALLIGGGVGTAAGLLLPESFDLLLLNVLLGITGSILGLGAYYFIVSAGIPNNAFDPRGILMMLVTSLFFVLIFNVIGMLMPKRAAHMGAAEKDEIIED